MTPRIRRAAVWGAIAAFLAILTWLRIALIDSLHDQGWFVKYYEFAGRAIEGRLPVERLGDVSPAYFWLIVVLRSVGLGLNAIRDLQISGVTLAALISALAAWRLGGRVAAVVTALLILGNRAALVMATDLEPEVLIMVLSSGAILAAVIWERSSAEGKRAWLAAGFAGLLFGLSATARPVALGAIVLVGLWMLLRDRRASALFVAAALLPLLAVVSVNRALTGSMSIMQPGSQFYDANNPLATGAAAVLPRIVLDLQLSASEPDYLHVAYRVVTSRATGQAADARQTNRYWSGKALAFIRAYPQRARELFAWKALLSIHNYDIYDLSTTRRKALELERWPAIPFGASVALAVVAIFVATDRRALVTVILAGAATVAALVLFNVTARQRNALLAPMAILGGVGAGGIARLARRKNDGALMAFGAAVIITPLLGIEGPPMKENDYVWRATALAGDLRAEARTLQAEGRTKAAVAAAANASILDPTRPALVPAAVLRAHALEQARAGQRPETRFDAAVALQRTGAWSESEAILAGLRGYRPLRENRAVSSVDYYRARAAIHRGASVDRVRTHLDRAIRQSPGDPHVLALRSVMGDGSAAALLDAMHDPFTRDYALALARADTGDRAGADALLAGLIDRIPEWKRPLRVRHALRTVQARGGSSEARE